MVPYKWKKPSLGVRKLSVFQSWFFHLPIRAKPLLPFCTVEIAKVKMKQGKIRHLVSVEEMVVAVPRAGHSVTIAVKYSALEVFFFF